MRGAAFIAALLIVACGHAQSLLGGVGGGGSGSYLPLGIFNGLTGLESVLNTDPVDHPRDVETRLLLGLGASVQMANLVGSTSGIDAGSFPWVGASLESGASFTYRDRCGVSLIGSWGINGYRLSLDTVRHQVYHTSKRAELDLWWLRRAGAQRTSRLKFGVALGFTFQRADELVRENNGYRAVTSAPYAVRPYIAPEIGRFGATGKDRFEVALRYVIHLDGNKAWEMNANLGANGATYNASDNYLSIVTRYHIGFKREEPRPPALIMVAYEERTMDTLATLHTRQRRITLRLWDDAEMDGDTISVLLNQLPVLSNHALTKEPFRLTLDLHRGWNFLTVVANNEGRVVPNTASCIVRRGKGKETLLIKTSHKQNQVVVIRCE
jgi:hypothetical protein